MGKKPRTHFSKDDEVRCNGVLGCTEQQTTVFDGLEIDELLEYNKKVNDVSAAVYGRGAHVLVCWLTTTTAVLGLITITMAS